MRALALVGVLILASCGDEAPIPDHDLWIHVETPNERVEAGRAFDLTIVRVWRRDLEPEALSDDALEPLALREVSIDRREDDQRVEETRVYRAYAFRPGRYVVPGPSFAAHPADGGASMIVRGNPVRMSVAPPLNAADPGAVEFPELVAPPMSWTPILAIGLALLAATGLWLHAKRRRETEEIADEEEGEPQGPSPAEFALAELERVRARAAGDADERIADHTLVAAITRTYVEAAFGVGHPELTSEELNTEARGAECVSESIRDRLGRILTACDGVKFARHAPTEPERDRVVDAAIELIRETTPAAVA